ncbi:hypothetical protein [Paenibacillus sp. NPDC055715]
MEKMEQLETLDMEKFDMLVQGYCDPNDCGHDCAPKGKNDCSGWFTGGW